MEFRLDPSRTTIQGVGREIAVPAAVEMSNDRWTGTADFKVPYTKWGMKNPSTLFLRVNDSVEVDLAAVGSVAPSNIQSRESAQ